MRYTLIFSKRLSRSIIIFWSTNYLFFGIGGNLIELLKSYLQNRKQRVRIRNQLSNWLDVTSGFPQGSILGPLLFLRFINDLPGGLKFSCFGSAFDYKMLSINSKDLQTDMNHLSKWCCDNNMSLNLSKCHNLIFKSDCTSRKTPIGEYELSEPNTEKDLGIILSKNLT